MSVIAQYSYYKNYAKVYIYTTGVILLAKFVIYVILLAKFVIYDKLLTKFVKTNNTKRISKGQWAQIL